MNWEKDNFNILGVTFNTDVKQMVDQNYSKALDSIKEILSHLSKRQLTVLGKITVVKPLALSKLTYITMTLPNPVEIFVTNLQRLLFQFIWSKMPDKVKRNQFYNSYKEGGVKMVNVTAFINSIEISWIRRIYNGNNDWCILFHDMHRDLGDLFSKSMQYITSYIKTMKNPFWLDVLAAWVNLNKNMAVRKPVEFLSQRV